MLFYIQFYAATSFSICNTPLEYSIIGPKIEMDIFYYIISIELTLNNQISLINETKYEIFALFDNNFTTERYVLQDSNFIFG